MIIDLTHAGSVQTEERGNWAGSCHPPLQAVDCANWVAAQSTCRSCGKIHDILNFATAESFNGDCDACGAYVCTIVYGPL